MHCDDVDIGDDFNVDDDDDDGGDGGGTPKAMMGVHTDAAGSALIALGIIRAHDDCNG